MRTANIATLRSKLSELLKFVIQGHELEIQKRNVTVARIVPVLKPLLNTTKLGAGKGTVKFTKTDLTQPIMKDDWEMTK